MHARPTLFVAALLAMITPATPLLADQTVPAATPAVRQAAAHENAFAFDLLRTVDRSANTGNIFLSPVSIDQAVSMLAAGSAGQTRAEIDATLHAGNAAPNSLSQAAALRNRLLAQSSGANPSVEITIANALWANRGITLRPAYVGACRSELGAKASTLDFSQPAAADTINQWVANQTKGKINSIIDRDALASASAVLTDAVYFHGSWDTPFNASLTKPAPFLTAAGVVKTVPMMTRNDSFMAAQTDVLQAVALPYGHSGMSMVVVLPRTGHSVDALARSLTPATWNHLMSSLQETPAFLFLPRFHLDYSTELRDSLIALGTRRVFSPTADLSPMSGTPLFISSVIHKDNIGRGREGNGGCGGDSHIRRHCIRSGAWAAADHDSRGSSIPLRYPRRFHRRAVISRLRAQSSIYQIRVALRASGSASESLLP